MPACSLAVQRRAEPRRLRLDSTLQNGEPSCLDARRAEPKRLRVVEARPRHTPLQALPDAARDGVEHPRGFVDALFRNNVLPDCQMSERNARELKSLVEAAETACAL